MIDTIKVRIPLTKRQWDKLFKWALSHDREQWALFSPTRGEIYITRIKGLAETDQYSHHRQLQWDIPQLWHEGDTYLTLEFSIPKFWYGHNVSLLYDWLPALEYLRTLLPSRIGLGRSRLAPVKDWLVTRLDVCYAWRTPNQATADAILDALKRMKYPWKKPRHYDGTCMWPGTTYSVKLYDKAKEFAHHDMKALVKANTPLEWVNALEAMAEGVVRFEATCRSKYLKRQGISTVGDLLQLDPKRSRFVMSEELKTWWDDAGLDESSIEAMRSLIGLAAMNPENDIKQGDSCRFEKDKPYRVKPMGWQMGDHSGIFPGGTITLKAVDRPTGILQELLEKFVGDGSMGISDSVREKLRTKYGNRKAGRLMGTWLYVQRFGADEAKSLYGRDTYYRDVREMREAGVTLIETSEQIVKVDPDFFNSFKFEIPSHAVVNRFDDFRDGHNLLNIANWQDKKAE